MNTLYIDTHLFDINIILFNNKKVIKKKEIKNEKKNSQYLMPSIIEVCDGNQIDEIVVITGPGSFTGVRLGVTIAKTFAYVKNIPIKAITFFDAMIASLDNKDVIFGINDNNGYFIAEYHEGRLKKDLFYISKSDFETYENKDSVIENVEINYEKLIEWLKGVKPINPHIVNPIYIKKIGVENDKWN